MISSKINSIKDDISLSEFESLKSQVESQFEELINCFSTENSMKINSNVSVISSANKSMDIVRPKTEPSKIRKNRIYSTSTVSNKFKRNTCIYTEESLIHQNPSAYLPQRIDSLFLPLFSATSQKSVDLEQNRVLLSQYSFFRI